MRIGMTWFAAFTFLSFSAAAAARAETLDIYFVDVEGGQSTLQVAPSGESLLIDAGFSGDGQSEPGDPTKARDANRILAAAHEAGISAIDYLLITHFHGDHFGGVPELAQLIPIRHFIDHGTPAAELLAEPDYQTLYDAYVKLRNRAPHLEPKPGDRLPLKTLNAIVVSSAGDTLVKPLPGAGKINSACRSTAVPPGDPAENPRSTGVLVEFGQFRFLDVGDLSGQQQYNLACPKGLIGPVDVYLVAHHADEDNADPAIYAAIEPRVAVTNNGLKKGGGLATYETLHHVPGLEDVWQLHWSKKAGDRNFASERIANPDESPGLLDQAERKQGWLLPRVEWANRRMEELPVAVSERSSLDRPPRQLKGVVSSNFRRYCGAPVSLGRTGVNFGHALCQLARKCPSRGRDPS